MQAPDNKPGNCYVSVVRGDGDWRPLVGPFRNDHAAALAMVDKARAKAEELDPRAAWYSFGTVRVDLVAYAPAGMLNKFFPEAFQPMKEAA